jgi:hypothetical protein
VEFSDPPAAAAWRHGTTRTALESVTFARQGGGWLAAGSTTALEAGTSWWVAYEIAVDASFITRRAVITSRAGAAAPSKATLDADGAGRWLLNGRRAPDLDGCLDVDLESSALTNAFPVRRAQLLVGATLDAPAAYVRVRDLAVERLDQRYLRRDDADRGPVFEYHAPAFDFTCDIGYDRAGLVVSYPGIAERVE